MVRMTNNLKEIDKKIGSNIMNLRVSGGFSRNELASYIEVTHQQMQKYEKGINRICIGRLLKIANFFQVECKIFYEDIENINDDTDCREQRQLLEIFKSLKKIDNEEFKNSIARMIRSYEKKI